MPIPNGQDRGRDGQKKKKLEFMIVFHFFSRLYASVTEDFCFNSFYSLFLSVQFSLSVSGILVDDYHDFFFNMLLKPCIC